MFRTGGLNLGLKSCCQVFGCSARAGLVALERRLHTPSISCPCKTSAGVIFTLEWVSLRSSGRARAGTLALERGRYGLGRDVAHPGQGVAQLSQASSSLADVFVTLLCAVTSLGIGITIWDIESGENLLHIPTSASPPHGLICLANQCLVASQIQRQGSVAGGVIFIWPFNKSSLLGSGVNPLLGHVAATGWVFPEKVADRPDKAWRKGVQQVKRYGLSDEAMTSASNKAYLTSYTEWHSGEGCATPRPRSYHSRTRSLGYKGNISASEAKQGWRSTKGFQDASRLRMTSAWDGLGPQAPVRSYTMQSIGQITCTKDGTYIVGGAPSENPYVWEVWDLVTGRLLQTRAFPLPITAIVVDPIDKKLFSGSADGTVFLNTLDFGVVEDTSIVLEDEPTLLTGHKSVQ
ncbi:hypothetical protein HYC85_029145 [Camellia sinensis]|uniref:Uncharacterized protein n=1 Tax=Camellia sinensis TaxID=4442 RepID=A0A7J7G143_CAMSI|nr:hypothetical protein HYC85_029145 [Camellia sinensis]